MNVEPGPESSYTADAVITGGTFFGTVIQGRYITVNLQPQLQPARTGLPRRSPTFVGREAEATALLGLWAADEESEGPVPVAMITGMPGVGKTELAIQCARRALERGYFPGGVLYADLFGYDEASRLTADAVLYGFLRALQVPPEHIVGDRQFLSALYFSILDRYAAEGKRLLVILDNASSPDQVRPLLPPDERTGFLVTSRNTMAVLDAQLIELNTLKPSDAVELVDRSVRHSRPSDGRVQADADSASTIVRLAGYLPLALRIVAAVLIREPGLPLGDFEAEFAEEHRRLDELQVDDRDVRAAFHLSYRRLSAAQARLFRLLSLNPGNDLSSESAAQLDDAANDQTRRTLRDLLDAHLVMVTAGAAERWSMHDLLRLFAAEQPEEPGERDAARVRLLEHYLDRARDLDRTMRGAPTAESSFEDRTQALTWADAEHSNLVSAGAMSIASGERRYAVELALVLAVYLTTTHRLKDAIDVGAQAAAVADDALVKARIINNLGIAYFRHGDDAAAARAYRDAADVFQSLDAARLYGIALNGLGQALRNLRRFDEAIDAFRQAIGVFESLGIAQLVAAGLNGLGTVLRARGEIPKALEVHEREMRILVEIGDEAGQSLALNSLGQLMVRAGRFEQAAEYHRRDLELNERLGDDLGQARARSNLGIALRDLGDAAAAAACHRQAAEVLGSLGDRRSEAVALDDLGLDLMAAGQPAEAADMHRRAAEFHGSVGDKFKQAGALDNLGTALSAAGRYAEAADAHRQDWEVSRSLGEAEDAASAATAMAVALEAAGLPHDAMRAYQAAADLYRELGDAVKEEAMLAQVRRLGGDGS
ncbi:ATP-binding protein [Actinospica durhamensis]|uniref:ATP-binding protein n=1 Tax=Actinospica durhamensis TaxID=1508375 RepID=A0A941EZ73_9ACTN|nr:tetratricopeptide repeat protein [Actinospica durhamensis]MBR7836809.1 ATP-binding protein [Actinospica durhamensis]